MVPNNRVFSIEDTKVQIIFSSNLMKASPLFRLSGFVCDSLSKTQLSVFNYIIIFPCFCY